MPVSVAVDVDEVLAQFIPALAQFHNDEYGTELSASSFCSYEFHKVWGGSVAESNAKMELFFASHHFTSRVEPVPGALETLTALKREFGSELELHIVTARKTAIKDVTLRWLETHYPGVFEMERVHFGNHYSADGSTSRSKPEMCQAVGAAILIDDSITYACQCAAVGIPVVLFGNYAWNTSSGDKELPSLVRRVHDWAAAEEFLVSFLRSTSSSSGQPKSPTSLARDVLIDASKGGRNVVGVIQLCSGNDRARNLSKVRALVEAASHAGASFCCLPEACLFLGNSRQETVANAREHHAEDLEEMKSLARVYQVYLSFCMAVPAPSSSSSSEDKVRNRHYLLNVLGEEMAFYDKIHLFDSPLASLFESASTVAGDGLVSVERGPFGAHTALSVCYDVRFPLTYYYPTSCPSLILVPSAFTKKTGEAGHWEVLLRARAIETQAWVVASAQTGRHSTETSRESYGNSMVVDPWGRIVLRLDGGDKEGVGLFSLDLDEVARVRSEMPVLDHRRHDCYNTRSSTTTTTTSTLPLLHKEA